MATQDAPLPRPGSSSKDPLARLIEQQSWPPPQAEVSVQDAIRAVFARLGPAGDSVRDALHGTWLHEPLHAVLTDIPVGSWTAAVLFDAIGAIAHSRKLDVAADAAVVLGLAGATGAAITGFNDWAEIKDQSPRRIGAAHAILNIAATGLFVGSLISRRKSGSRTNARSLAILGYVLASVSAHLGGNLVYEHGIGMDDGKHWRG